MRHGGVQDHGSQGALHAKHFLRRGVSRRGQPGPPWIRQVQNIVAVYYELVPILLSYKCAFLSLAIHKMLAIAVRSLRSLEHHSRLAAKRIDHPAMPLKLTPCH